MRVLGVLVGAALALVPTGASGHAAGDPGHYRGFGDAGGFLDVLPPGQEGNLDATELAAAQAANASGTSDPTAYPRHFADQRALYDSLLFHGSTLSDTDLTRYFKDASFGVAADDIGRTYHPRADVTVVRDRSSGVAHIFGRTRYATMFAEGYTTAEDRLLMMDVLRHLGRGRLSELTGPAGLDIDRRTVTESPYTEADLAGQLRRLRESGSLGRAVVDDLDAYADGVNRFLAEAAADPAKLPAEYGLLGRRPERWRTTDSVAVAADIGAILGKGGGRELTNWCGLERLADRVGARDARQIFDDLKFADDPSAPTTSARRAPYPTGLGRRDPHAVPDVDCATLRPTIAEPTAGGQGPAFLAPLVEQVRRPTPATSSAVLVAANATATGRPIALFGPQVGYTVPSVLVEKDVHGPGIDARGVGFAGIDAYVVMGRGRDYAWSATSSGADEIDTFVLKLCDPGGGPPATSSSGYEHDGRCRKIQRFHHRIRVASPGAGSALDEDWIVERAPDYGPITMHGTTRDGTPVAIALRRSTYEDEVRSALGFRKLNDPDQMRPGFTAFRDATGAGVLFSFNWFYVDGAHIGYQHSCKCPVRAGGVDPDLPVWGTGRWDWHGFLPPVRQPTELDPKSGYLASWNNKQAPGFRASDAQFSFGPVQRVQLLDRRIAAVLRGGAPLHPADVVQLTEDAATVDLRGAELVGTLLEVMGPEPPAATDPRVAELRARLAAWAKAGAHRRADGPGAPYEDAVAPAVMDAWWAAIPGTIFGAGSESPFEALGLRIDDSPRAHIGSAWDDGAYSAVEQDLRQVLGKKVEGAWPRPFCGRGDRATCRELLWRSLGAAAASLEQEFASPDVAAWQRTPVDDQIRFAPLLVGLPPIDWQNRPTFQQIVQLERRGSAGVATTGAGGGVLTVVVSVVVGIVVAGIALVVARRQLRTQPARRRRGHPPAMRRGPPVNGLGPGPLEGNGRKG